jgi:hypothetical protein
MCYLKSYVLHYYVHKKANPMQMQGERVSILIIDTKKKKNPAPTQNIAEGIMPSFWVRRPGRCLLIVVVAVSSSLSWLSPLPRPCRPWPCCSPVPPREQLLTTAVGDLVVVVVMAVLVLIFPSSSWSCCTVGRWVVGRRSVVVSLPVVGVAVSSPSHAAPCLHPASSCS